MTIISKLLTYMDYHDKYKKYKTKYLKLRSAMTDLNIVIRAYGFDVPKIDIYARYGISNPEKKNDNFFWQYMVDHPDYESWKARQIIDANPHWPIYSFDRLGQATKIFNGKKIYIGGSYEDSYDPDFFIYNDIVVIDDNNIDIYIYPQDVFPPIEDAIVEERDGKLIISGGTQYIADYREDREFNWAFTTKDNNTYELDLRTFRITMI